MASHVHWRIVRPQDIQPQDEFVRDLGDEHPKLRMRHPKVSSPRAPFTTGIVSPDALCNTHSRLSFLSGCPTTMSGLAIFTDAIVPMVTRHGFSYIQPSAISPSSVTLSSKLSVKRGGESDHAGSLLLASSSGSSSHTASLRTTSRSDSQHTGRP
jgi:hypothetical protein